ncbi:hypothetical protein C1645_480235 [Glomus cerebriforme]|uniref:Uncharacterized protein n=1 Tax=Glomus cerebriforme TaxID=658196 RepID=A0A397TB74_9GLOM|nr:hypothetical protein C1645_480235 [Glomus cerebriforme]
MFELIIVIAVFVPSILIFSWQNLDNRIAIIDNFIKQRELTLIKLREVKNKYEARSNILNLGRIVTNVASTAAMLVSNKNTRNVLNVGRTISAVSIPFVQIFLDESSSSEFQGVLEKDHKRKDKLMKMLMKEKNGWETLKEINSGTKKLALKKKSMKSSSPVDDFIDIFFCYS